MTSAAVDAYCAGLPVITVLDQVTLNMSPVRGCKGVKFVETQADLVRALSKAAAAPRPEIRSVRFFNLDSRLPKWNRLLSAISDR